MNAKNRHLEVLPSVARIATISSPDIPNIGANGVHIVIDVTDVTATPSVVPTVEGKDPLSGKYYTLLTGAAITATGTTILKVFPSATAVANLAANDFVPSKFRVTMTHGDADSITYSIGANLN